MQETIDVLIPAFNVEKYIGKCLASLTNQTYKNLRIVVVDDGSTDKTYEIVKSFQEKFPNIELYSKENEKNISKTRNFLLGKIKSKYFSFFDSDDHCHTTYFEELYNNIVAYDADISMCNKVWSKDKEVDFDKINIKNTKIFVLNQTETIAEMLSAKLYAGTCPMKLMKSELIGSLKFNPNIHYGEDLDFCFRYMQNCKKTVYTNRKLYFYVIRKNSIVSSKFNIKKVSCVDCYQNIVDEVKENPELFTCAKSMQGLIAIEILYYTWRDKFKDKALKKRLKTLIKESIPHIKKNKRLRRLHRCVPSIWWITKVM